MASRYWRGTTTVWNSTANWAATRTGVTGASVPTTGDDVFILDGSGPIDPYNAGADDLLSLTIGGNFTGAILGLTVAVSGKTEISCSADITLTAGTNNIDDLRIYSTGGATVTLAGGTFTAAQFGTGSIIIESAATVTTLSNSAARVVDTGGTAYTTVTTEGGTFITMKGGTTLNATARVVNLTNAAWTTINARRGGFVTHNSAGTIGTATAYPGATLTDAPAGVQNINGIVVNGQATPFTLTNSVEWLGGSLFRDATATITKSNATTYVGKAG